MKLVVRKQKKTKQIRKEDVLKKAEKYIINLPFLHKQIL